MNRSLRFSHKILIAASLIVMLAFALFTLYNDYLQRNATRTSLENYLAEMGESTSITSAICWKGGSVWWKTWGRILPRIPLMLKP